MKLGTLRNGQRDGQLVVVSRDLSVFAAATGIAATLQAALDQWESLEPKLQALSAAVNARSVKTETFRAELFHSPLPRAYEWVDGSAYINHVILVRKARGAEPPPTLRTDPLVYQGGSGVFLGPTDPIPLGDRSWGLDFESEVCVILGDTPQGTSVAEAGRYVRLITIANDVSLRGLIPGELEKGFGFFCSKPATAFAPVAITPDELGDAWHDGRIHLPLVTHYNGEVFGRPEAGPEMHFSFYDLISHITKTRAYTAGTILGSGTVSNAERSVGSSCLAEVRMLEKIEQDKISTRFMQGGDRVSIELFDRSGRSLCGRIQQVVVES